MRRVSVPSDHVAVIGCGASALIAELVADGYVSIEAADVSQGALDQLGHQLQNRLGVAAAGVVRQMRADMRSVTFDDPVAVWHDRAAFHFLTEPADQADYARAAAAAVHPGGHVVLAAFGEHGPEQCSGLPVARHSPATLTALFGEKFELLETSERDHITPAGSPQRFIHALMRRRGLA